MPCVKSIREIHQTNKIITVNVRTDRPISGGTIIRLDMHRLHLMSTQCWPTETVMRLCSIMKMQRSFIVIIYVR